MILFVVFKYICIFYFEFWMIHFFSHNLLCRKSYSVLRNGAISSNIAIVLFVILFLSNSCVRQQTPPTVNISTNLEELSANGKKFTATNDSTYQFNGGQYQSQLHHRSGKNSVYSTPENPFTLAIDFSNVYRDSYVDVTVWKKGHDAHLVCVLMGTKKYFSVMDVVETDDYGWEKLSSQFYVPPLTEYNQLKFYVWNSGNDTIYYDDLSLTILKNKPFPEFSLSSFHLEMDTSEIISLMETRKTAFKAGILQSKEEDIVEGIVFSDDKMMKATLRLKGDWLDHMHGSKWSYRIKLNKGKTWNRMNVFSIQNPMARLGVNEWFLHQVMIGEGLLTTRYGFVPVTQNGKNMGLYAWEEHFAKQLLESQNRREGPIVRFVEDALWDARILDPEGRMNGKITPVFDVAVIKPFSSGKIVSDSNMFKQFLIAQNLMMQYKNRSKSASEIFNIDMLARYFALADVFLARHSLIWHNQRFYYNPVICKLEPIAYDCYSDIGLEEQIPNPITGFLRGGVTQPDEYIMIRELFNDTAFVSKYVNLLDYYSNPDVLDSIFGSYQYQVAYYDSLVRREYPSQIFYKANIKLNAIKIKKALPLFKKQLYDMKEDNKKWENHTLERNDYDTVLPAFFAPNLVLAYKEKVVGDSTIIKVKNFFTEQVFILGVGMNSNKIREIVFPIPVLDASNKGRPKEITFVVSNEQVNYLLFSVASSDEILSIEINQWPEPDGTSTPLQKLTALYPFPDTSLIDRVIGKDVFIKKGKVVMDHPALIPTGYNVHFSKGTTIDLIEKASIISNSAVFMKGTKELPVVITSSDSTSKGFVVLQADNKSILNNVHFEKLNTIDYDGWGHTGAVTFYESDVEINNASFSHNQCEDALNIIRSEFTMNNSSFSKIFGDAFDTDFCNGEIITTTFTNIGNDAMDFSGSQITIRNSVVDGANDKGISGGEDSKLTIYNTSISNSNIGLASKDLSVVEVFDSRVESCNYGVVLLQKKPEYGPSIMILKNTQLLNLKSDMLIELNSKVVIDDQIIMGTEQNLSEIFY